MILSPGHVAVQTVCLLWRTRATIHCTQDSSDRAYSPMIFTNTRFRRRPSRLQGQPFRLALEDPLPGAEDFGELGEAGQTAVCDGNHRCASRPTTRNTASCVPLQVRVGQACRRQAPVPTSRTGVLSGPIVHPAQGPASSLMNTLAVMFLAFTRVNALFIIYYSHTTDCRGHCGHRPRPEQPQLNPTFTGENESCCGSAYRYCAGKASRQQGALKGSSWVVKNWLISVRSWDVRMSPE